MRGVQTRGLSIGISLLVWWLLSLFFPPNFFPGPATVLAKVSAILVTGEFIFHMGQTLKRVVVGFSLAFFISLATGILMGSYKTAEELLDLDILVGLTIPGLTWGMITLLWFGISDWAAIAAIVLVVVPVVTVNIWEGTRALDYELFEMGRSFEASRQLLLREIVIPQLVPYVFASVRFGLAMAWKVIVLSEMLGLSNGIGYMVNYSFGLFDMEGVMAWTLCFTLAMIIIEYGFLKVMEDRVTRWRPSGGRR